MEATVHTHYGSTDCGRTEHAGQEGWKLQYSDVTCLSPPGQEGWKLQYSDNFLRNMTDAERVMLIGTTQAMPNCEEDGCSDDGSLADSSPDPTPTPTPTPSPSPSPSSGPNPSHNPNQARSPTRAMGT